MLNAKDSDRLERYLLHINVFTNLDRNRHHDLHYFWRALGPDGEVPPSLGAKFDASIDKNLKVLKDELARKYKEYDKRRETEVQERCSHLCQRLGAFLSECEQLEDAANLQQRALDIDHTLYNNMSRRVAESTIALAKTRHAQNRSEEAVQMLYLSYGIYKQLAQSDTTQPDNGSDPDALFDSATTLVLIAKVARNTKGGLSQAKSMMGHALRIYRQVLGDKHPDVAGVLNSLSVLCVELGNTLGEKEEKVMLGEARLFAEEALQISDNCVTEGDLPAAESRRVLGKLCMAEGDLSAAIKHLEKAADLLTMIYGYDALPLAEVMEDQAWARLRLHHAEHGFRQRPAASEEVADVSEEQPAGVAAAGAAGAGAAATTGDNSQAAAADGAEAEGSVKLPAIEPGAAASAVASSGAPPAEDSAAAGLDSGGSRARMGHDKEGEKLAAATDAGGARERPPAADEDDEYDDDDEEEDLSTDVGLAGALQLLTRARAIRLAKQGGMHQAYARCLIKLGDYYWLLDNYQKVVELYTEAVVILTEHGTERSKPVVMLTSWLVHAHILLGNLQEATKINERVLALAKPVFGDLSWELWRVMIDKVWLIQHSINPDAAANSTEARKAFSMAERIETHAQILLNSLQADKVEDDKISELSTFASLKREIVLRPEDGPAGIDGVPRRGKRKAKRLESLDHKSSNLKPMPPKAKRGASTGANAGLREPSVRRERSDPSTGRPKSISPPKHP